MTTILPVDTHPAAKDTDATDSPSLINNNNVSMNTDINGCITDAGKASSSSEEENSVDSCAAGKSLVADYSDSDSGSEV